jgi:hypothetical protein
MRLGLYVAICLFGIVVHTASPTMQTPNSPNTPASAAAASTSFLTAFPKELPTKVINGEVTVLDALERTAVIRLDRTDDQQRGDFDLPHAVDLLPYARIVYQGALAELRDIPLGTHMHGLFYAIPPETPVKKKQPAKRSGEDPRYRLALLWEDDVSHALRTQKQWTVVEYLPEKNQLNVQGTGDASTTLWELTPASRIYLGRGFASPTDIRPGQRVQANLTQCTLFGPGRVRDLWLDTESLAYATARQREAHKLYQKERGLPALIEHVDNRNRIVTAMVFDAVDDTLLDAFQEKTSVTAVVAEANLRTYDPVNDRKAGPLLKKTRVEKSPGAAGVRLVFQPDLLLEGFRPGRIVRLFAAGWPVKDPPREERLFGN